MAIYAFARSAAVITCAAAIAGCGNRDAVSPPESATLMVVVNTPIPDAGAVVVTGQPWGAYNWYVGGLASRVELNADLPMRSHFFAPMVAHEGYPGHHTEHASKEARLVRELGRPEASAAGPSSIHRSVDVAPSTRGWAERLIGLVALHVGEVIVRALLRVRLGLSTDTVVPAGESPSEVARTWTTPAAGHDTREV
jgi:hypothetical protein